MTKPTDSPPQIAYWHGKQVSKMSRADLERDFVRLATAWAHDIGTAPTPGSPLDPQTARCLNELRAVIRGIEEGELALRRYADEVNEERGQLDRCVIVRATILPTKPKG